ncbi:MAG: hypothetical protein R8K50_06240 [Mariprofundus sp.]
MAKLIKLENNLLGKPFTPLEHLLGLSTLALLLSPWSVLGLIPFAWLSRPSLHAE